ncbi:hypothetical protein H9P43_002198 [Blastocladiella emersonii ATCC 22665]|nr:hypothetical protein H9P43_002198 [Blastocladiella emersonii ATCC 22665]
MDSSKSFEDRLPRVFGAPLIRVVNLVMLIAVFVVNGLANTTLYNGVRTNEVSDALPNYFVPAGYAFSIWGIIYMFLAAWGIYQILPRSYDSAMLNDAVGWVFPVNAALNMSWIVLWAYGQKPLSVVLITAILATNLIIYARLKLRHRGASCSWLEYVCVHVGFSFYTAWLMGACLVNLWAVSSARTSDVIPQTVAGLVLLGVGEIWLALWAQDPIITGVGTWTLVANYAVNKNVDVLGPAVLGLAVILGVFTAGLWAFRGFRVVKRKEYGSRMPA